MIKNAVIILLTALSLIFLTDISKACCDENINPINKTFDVLLSDAPNTAERNEITQKYLEAWKNEFENAVMQVKGGYKFGEDKKTIDKYASDYRALAKKANEMELLKWSDTESKPGKDRYGSIGSGAQAATMRAEAEIYKQATLNLIQFYNNNSNESIYKYIHKTGK